MAGSKTKAVKINLDHQVLKKQTNENNSLRPKLKNFSSRMMTVLVHNPKDKNIYESILT